MRYIDEQLVLAPYSWLAELVGYDGLASDVEVFVDQTANLSKIKRQIKQILGPDYNVNDQYEQQSTLYKMMKSEKLAVYLILVFILIMATFNVIASLSMLIIEKRKDTGILLSMGGDSSLIRSIFLHEGTIISVVGGIIGLIIGIIAVLLQQYVGFIRLGDGSGSYIS